MTKSEELDFITEKMNTAVEANSFRLGADFILSKRKDEKDFLNFFMFDGFNKELYNKGKEWALN